MTGGKSNSITAAKPKLCKLLNYNKDNTHKQTQTESSTTILSVDTQQHFRQLARHCGFDPGLPAPPTHYLPVCGDTV